MSSLNISKLLVGFLFLTNSVLQYSAACSISVGKLMYQVDNYAETHLMKRRWAFIRSHSSMFIARFPPSPSQQIPDTLMTAVDLIYDTSGESLRTLSPSRPVKSVAGPAVD